MSVRVLRLLVAALTVVAIAVTATASAKTSYSKGCNTKACQARVCQSSTCKTRVASKHAASRPGIPARVSWYGPGLYGNHLACGGTLSPGTAGVANKSLPCGAAVRICYQGCVTTRVIDRGPYVAGREFDLTAPVHQAIGRPSVQSTVRWYRVG